MDGMPGKRFAQLQYFLSWQRLLSTFAHLVTSLQQHRRVLPALSICGVMCIVAATHSSTEGLITTKNQHGHTQDMGSYDGVSTLPCCQLLYSATNLLYKDPVLHMVKLAVARIIASGTVTSCPASQYLPQALRPLRQRYLQLLLLHVGFAVCLLRFAGSEQLCAYQQGSIHQQHCVTDHA